MGWGRTFLLGDVGNRMDIEDVERDVAEMKRSLHAEADSADENFQKLARECAELRLYLATIIRLMASKGVITKDEIQAMVYAIDREDGYLDGQYNGKLQP